MEKKPETPISPLDDIQKLKGGPLKAAQKKLTEQGFILHGHYSGNESGMGEFVMLIAKLTSEKSEFKLIDNTSEIEIWIKPSASEGVVEEVREEIFPLVGSGD